MLTIYLPYIPLSLAQLLLSPYFSPFPSTSASLPVSDPTQEAHMTVLAKSITFQTLSAIAYLHDPACGIAHRDIKPANILLTPEGRVMLIDFGIAWTDAGDSQGDLWPEEPGRMYFEVSTGYLIVSTSVWRADGGLQRISCTRTIVWDSLLRCCCD
jgi:serine/threonine protein kinase